MDLLRHNSSLTIRRSRILDTTETKAQHRFYLVDSKHMARSLLLMRHAKSDWSDAVLTDLARPLNQRGRASAPIMAKWVVENSLMPSLVLCSSANRTQQTLELMMHYWTSMQHTISNLKMPEIQIDEGLYLASDSLILSIVSDTPAIGDKQRILILGHNPGMEILASKLSDIPIEMPTGAIALLDSNSAEDRWPDDWSSSQFWKWRGLVKPRVLGRETI